MWRKWNPVHCWWECKMVQLLWKTERQSLQKLRRGLPCDLAIPLLGIYPKELKAGSWRDICTPTFIAGLFTIAKTWKQLKCPSTDEWISKMWYTHVTECYSASERKDVLTRAIAWMNLEDIMLSAVSQSQKRQILYDYPFMRYQEQWDS